jgi:hypothetical protein
MVAILVHNHLQGIQLDDLHYLCLNTRLVMSIFHKFLYDSASVTMQANKQKFLLSHLINELSLGLAAHLDVLLHHIIAKFIVDEHMDLLVKILKDLILDVLVACLQGSLDIPGAVLIAAPLGDIDQVIEDVLMRGIYRKVGYGRGVDALEAVVLRILLLRLQTQPAWGWCYLRVLLSWISNSVTSQVFYFCYSLEEEPNWCTSHVFWPSSKKSSSI